MNISNVLDAVNENSVPIPAPHTPFVTPNYAGHKFVEEMKQKRFFQYRVTPSVRPGKKWDKKALLPENFTEADLGYAEEVIQRLPALGHCLGFYFYAEDEYFFHDQDGCHDAETNEYTQIARKILPRFQGAYMEQSISAEGVHVVGRRKGERPAHGCKNSAEGIELYTAGRGMAIGTPFEGTGSVNADCTDALQWLIAEYFPAPTGSKGKGDWTTGPQEDWDGPTDDAELLKIFLRNEKLIPTNRQLWEGDSAALTAWRPEPGRKDGLTFDATAVDFEIAKRLMFQDGNNCERTFQLMTTSPYGELRQDKWNEGRVSVLKRETICKAFQENVYRRNHRAEENFGKAQVPAPMPRPLTVPDGTPNELTPDDFWAHLPSHKYINRFTRETYSVDAINGHLKRFTNGACQGMKPATWLDIYRAVHQMSWHPGYPEIIEGMRSDNGVLKPEPTGRIFNRYRESDVIGSDGDASPWVNHIKRIYPTDADYILQWFAYRIQNPGVKINHALVLGSIQGTGKDWILKPLRYALGPANVATIKPTELFSQFNDWVESTLLIINEARDMGDENRYSFYEATKPLIAGPPDTLRCNLKGQTPYSVPNVMAVVITTNNKLSGLYLPADDRRHYVTWSPAERPSTDYFDHLWDWMDNRGGKEAVVGYLQRLDVSGFGAQADPPKTEAWHQVVAASINPDELSLSDAIEGLQIATVKEIIATLQLKGYTELAFSLQKSPRKIPHILETAGFEVLPNPHSKGDGRWRLTDGRRETIYVDRKLPLSQRLELANAKSRA
jgi:hypothetical protein